MLWVLFDCFLMSCFCNVDLFLSPLSYGWIVSVELIIIIIIRCPARWLRWSTFLPTALFLNLIKQIWIYFILIGIAWYKVFLFFIFSYYFFSNLKPPWNIMPMHHQGKNNSPVSDRLVYHDIGLFYVWAKCIRWIFIHIEEVYTNAACKVKEERFYCIFLCTYDILCFLCNA